MWILFTLFVSVFGGIVEDLNVADILGGFMYPTETIKPIKPIKPLFEETTSIHTMSVYLDNNNISLACLNGRPKNYNLIQNYEPELKIIFCEDNSTLSSRCVLRRHDQIRSFHSNQFEKSYQALFIPVMDNFSSTVWTKIQYLNIRGAFMYYYDYEEPEWLADFANHYPYYFVRIDDPHIRADMGMSVNESSIMFLNNSDTQERYKYDGDVTNETVVLNFLIDVISGTHPVDLICNKNGYVVPHEKTTKLDTYSYLDFIKQNSLVLHYETGTNIEPYIDMLEKIQTSAKRIECGHYNVMDNEIFVRLDGFLPKLVLFFNGRIIPYHDDIHKFENWLESILFS